MLSQKTGLILLAAALLLVGFASVPAAQQPKPWRHGVIEPKGDAGFMVMVGQGGIHSRTPPPGPSSLSTIVPML